MSDVTVKNMSFKKGQTLTITGIPKDDCTSFSINIGNNNMELALHLNPRFDAGGDKRTVICNSRQGGQWGEEHREKTFPFNEGELFKVQFSFTDKDFKINLPKGSVIQFPNRLGAEKYNYLWFEGKARIQGIEIK